jgi:hypothetical protein
VTDRRARLRGMAQWLQRADEDLLYTPDASNLPAPGVSEPLHHRFDLGQRLASRHQTDQLRALWHHVEGPHYAFWLLIPARMGQEALTQRPVDRWVFDLAGPVVIIALDWDQGTRELTVRFDCPTLELEERADDVWAWGHIPVVECLPATAVDETSIA